jgi:protein-S-isoprenylcysteine O-methyltransferase Ste14
MNLDYIIYAGLWVAYFSLHSILAANGLKNQIIGLGVSPNVYRLIYVLISVIGLFGVMFYGATIRDEPIIASTGGLKFVGLMMATFGIFIVKQTFRQYKLSGFLGLSNENSESKLETGGILNRIRHPLYSATILIVGGFVFFKPNWTSVIFLACTLLYLAVGIYLEEKKLVELFGDRYVEYKKRVPGLVPKWKK